ncbi:DUF402 domain-containing protein [Sporosarcina highlanderae]|uniref:DUF402 domain-containing protein n=1 Tax=Sporosarcina highlanderae TaxID=3035916 RepID=A0ABT8JRT6_9BACL|nr:DUF402 domain-containing protein [Sporosarcina highlanderae]MDN4607871.1 DUF402 domain-containing protein [Sporosarcina highlanderae]
MLKRKYGSRYDWKRILKKSYVEKYYETAQFTGHVSLFRMNEVSEPLFKMYGKKNTCIAAKGYSWLQHFPDDEHYSVTTVFNDENQVVQWYIDICKQNGYCETNGPWMDDLFLDLIVLPTGELIEKDEDELEDALNKEIITKHDYDQAWLENRKLKTLIEDRRFDLLELANVHFAELAKNITIKE